MYYAAESDKGLDMTYDSPCWMVLAFSTKSSRDKHVQSHDNVESVTAKTAKKIAPELRTKPADEAWRVVCM